MTAPVTGIDFTGGKSVDPSQLFAPVPIPAHVETAPKLSRRERKRGREELDGEKNVEIKRFREVAKKRKKHLSHLHDPLDKNEVERTVFVGNLPNDCTSKQLRKIFIGCGEIENTRIRNQILDMNAISKDGKDRGRGVRVLRGEIAKDNSKSANGYVLFKNASSVPNALRLSGTVHLERHLVVTKEDPQSKAYDPQNSIYLGNVSYNVTDEEIWQLFIELGFTDVTRVRVPRNKDTGEGQGFAYVSFRDPSSTNRAIQVGRGAMLAGRELRICHVQRPKDPKYKVKSRREIRQEADVLADKAGPTKGGKGRPKTSTKRQAAEEASANPSWMGAVTNPRKKMPRDLRPLIPVSPAERRAKKVASGGGSKKVAVTRKPRS